MPRRNLVWLCGIGLLSLFCWTVARGSLVAPTGPLRHVRAMPGNNIKDKDYERLSLFIDILEHVEQSYVHELTDEERAKAFESAIQGFLQTLDPHSAYFNPKEYKQFERQNKGSFGGIGIQINLNRDTKKLVVISPIPGTPAQQAGIKPGDEIEKINGDATKEMTLEDAVDKIQGPPETEIVLTIRHRGSDTTNEIRLKRKRIEVETVQGDRRTKDKQWDYLLDAESKIGYIRLDQFNVKSTDDVKSALQGLEARGAKGLILDLRNNPGGLLNKSVEIGDLFLTKGKIVSIEGRNRSPVVYEAKDDGLWSEKVPLVVLVNNRSASASEIVAAALQDHQRAYVIGERSYGKGSVQNLISIENGASALKLTTAKYIRPSGENIHRFPNMKKEEAWGVRPNLETELTQEEEFDLLTARRERDILRDNPADWERDDRKAAALSPTWGFSLLATPGSPLLTAVERAAAYRALPRPFVDKVRDQAVSYLKEKLGKG